MVSARAAHRATALCLAVAALLLAAPTHAAAASRLIVIGLPSGEWQRVAAGHPAALALGVYPDSRSGGRFVEEIGAGSPQGTSGAAGGTPGTLGRALSRAGLSIGISSADPAEILHPLARAFAPDPSYVVLTDLDGALASDVAVVPVAAAAEAEGLIARADGPVVLLGVGERTPVLISVCASGGCRDDRPALLEGGIARRPAIATPYDVAATVLDLVGVPRPSTVIGKPLRPEITTDPLARVRALATRLQRDASHTPALAATSVTICIVLLGVAAALHRAGRSRLAQRFAQAAALSVPGWFASHFVPGGRVEPRLLVVAAAAVIGGLVSSSDPARTMGRVGLALAAAFAVVVAVALLRPGGEPGLSVWGNPLVSWRFFGLQNVHAAFIASGVVVWGVLAGLGPVALAAVAAAAAVVIGAPAIGANFVGVLTFVFGASVAIITLARRRLEPWSLIAAGALAVGAFAAALLADAGSPVSHGGRAARRISEGGFGAAVDLVAGRLRLNIDSIRAFFGGIPITILVLVLIAALTVWGMRVERGPIRGRVAVLAGALMALTSLVLEDSGFYSGTVLFFAAAVGWVLVRASDAERVRSGAPSDGAG